MLIIKIVEQHGIVRMLRRTRREFHWKWWFLFFLRTNAARPQPETSTGRRQVDDEDTHQSLSNTSNASRSAATAVSNSTANVTDDLGPLPPGWQMSKTENERMFFIDHINKRTTWVKTSFSEANFRWKHQIFSRSIQERENQVHCQVHNVK